MDGDDAKLLREWHAEDDYVTEQQHDEYEFEELAHKIQTAVQTNSEIPATTFQMATNNLEIMGYEHTINYILYQT